MDVNTKSGQMHNYIKLGNDHRPWCFVVTPAAGCDLLLLVVALKQAVAPAVVYDSSCWQ